MTLNHIVYTPADGEELPDPDLAPVDAVISGLPVQVISAIVDEAFTTIGTVHYRGTLTDPIQVLAEGDSVNHQFAGWPVPTDIMPVV